MKLDDEQRRDAMLFLRDTYEASKLLRRDSRKTRRTAELLLYALTETLEDHNDIPGLGEWEHPCLCVECRSNA